MHLAAHEAKGVPALVIGDDENDVGTGHLPLHQLRKAGHEKDQSQKVFHGSGTGRAPIAVTPGNLAATRPFINIKSKPIHVALTSLHYDFTKHNRAGALGLNPAARILTISSICNPP